MDLGLIILFVLMGVSVYALIRNEQVHTYRINIIKRIHDAALEDIRNGNYDYDWRWGEYNDVSYSRMLMSFGSLDKFYPRDPARTER